MERKIGYTNLKVYPFFSGVFYEKAGNAFCDRHFGLFYGLFYLFGGGHYVDNAE